MHLALFFYLSKRPLHSQNEISATDRFNLGWPRTQKNNIQSRHTGGFKKGFLLHILADKNIAYRKCIKAYET